MTEKNCPKCKNKKKLDEFGKHSGKIRSWCKECEKMEAKKYRTLNYEKSKSSVNKYHASHRDKVNLIAKLWRKNNPIKAFLSVKNWQLNNQEKIREYATKNYHIRRGRKLGIGGKITKDEWQEVLEKYNYTCLCCGRNDVKLAMDHVIPVSLGGENNIRNIQPLCKSCNSSKKNKTIDYRIGYKNAY